MSVNQDYANNVSRILQDLGRVRAQGSANLGQIGGGFLADLGQTIAQAPERKLRQQQIEAQTADLQSLAEERKFQQQQRTQQMQDSAKGQAAIVQALQDPANRDPNTGQIDHRKVAQAVQMVSPLAADAYLTQALKHEELWNGLAKNDEEQQQHSTDVLARTFADVKTPEEADAVLALNATHGSRIVDGQTADQLQMQIRQGGQPALDAIKKHLYSLSTEGQAVSKKLNEPTMFPAGSEMKIPGTGQVLATGGVKPPANDIEAAIAAVAKDPAHPTPDELNQALDRVKPPKDQQAAQVGTLSDYLLKRFGANPTDSQILAGRRAYEATNRLPPTPAADKLIKVEHKDTATGRTVIEWLPQSEVKGQKFEKGTSATVENRLASATAVQQTGDDIISMLDDPKTRAALGPIQGRYTSVKEFIGNPPPEFSELAGAIESYALANMGVHGMRSTQGAEQIKALLEKKFTPENLKASIRGLQKFSQHFMENEGRTAGAPTTPPGTVRRYNPATGKVE